MAGIGYSPYTGAGNLASAFGANPNFGGSVGGYGGGTGGYQSGGYQYPNNVGGVNYSGAAPSGYAWGANGLVPIGTGAAGIQAYNPAISTSPTRSFQAPSFTNSMSNWLGGSNYANVASPFATQMMGQGDPSGFTNGMSNRSLAVANSLYGGSGGQTDRFGNPVGTGSQGSFNSAYDPQNAAYGMMYQNKMPNDPTNALAINNLARYNNAFNNFGFGSPYAGQGMASVAGAESSGNVFAMNPGSNAFGMNQYSPQGSNYSRYANAMGLLGGSPSGYYGPGYGGPGYSGMNTSPEMQAALTASEIRGGGYGNVYSTLNNPNSSLNQIQQAGIGQYEGLDPNKYPGQYASDMAGAGRYAGQLTPSALANAAASIAQYQPSQQGGRFH